MQGALEANAAALSFVAATNASGGINFGGDVAMYRSNADELRIPDKLVLGPDGTAAVGQALDAVRTAGTDPIAVFRTTSGTCTIEMRTGSGTLKFAGSATSDHWVTGDVSGDWAIGPSTTGDKLHLGQVNATADQAPAITVEAVASAASKLSFFGVATVSRQTIGGAASGTAQVETLANNMRTALINLGLCQT
jgi:hypothetical protein